MTGSRQVEDQIVAALRRIIRAIDLQSRRLLERHKLTGPQLATLREAARLGQPSTSALARAVHLSQPTVSGILDRLERAGLVERARWSGDRRNVVVSVTEAGETVLREAPSLLQDRFRAELAGLEDWERMGLLSALERIATMMDAGGLEAASDLDVSDALAAPPAGGLGDDDRGGDAGAEEV